MVDDSLDYSKIDFRESPELYRVGKAEQGVLLVEPYKSELLPLWRFKTPREAQASVKALLKKFQEYYAVKDFAGMDMTRKYVQMGYSRSRRFASPESTVIFKEALRTINRNQTYSRMKGLWKKWYG